LEGKTTLHEISPNIKMIWLSIPEERLRVDKEVTVSSEYRGLALR
jgi:hypothetical protein